MARLPAPGAGRRAIAISSVVLVAALWGAFLAILLFTASWLYSLPLIAGTVFPLALYASRNPRLFFLLGTVFTATLGLSINFQFRVHMGGAPSFAIDAMDLFLVPLVAFLVRDYSKGLRRDFVIPRVSGWWLALAALGFVPIIMGPFRLFPTFEVVRMLKCWILFLVIVNECVREKHFKHVTLALFAAITVNVIVGMIQYWLKRDLGLQALGEPSKEAITGANWGVYLGGDIFRVGALMGHPNLYSAWLAMLLPIAIALLFIARGRIERAVLAFVIGGGALSLLLTLSRTGWLDFGLAFTLLSAVLFLHPALRYRFAFQKSILVAAVVCGALLASGLIIKRFTESHSGALDFRQEWVGVAWSMVLDHPILGFGLNTFSHNVVPYSPHSVSKMLDLFGKTFPVVHNIYMLVWAEQGTIGLLLFLALNLHIVWIGIGNLRHIRSETVFMVSLGASCGLVAIMLDGIGSFFVRVPAAGRTWWIVIGLVVAAHYWNQRNEALRRQGDATTRQTRQGD